MRRGLAEARSRGLDYEVALLLQLDAQCSSDHGDASLAEAAEILARLGVRTDAGPAASSR